jgi:hypothetical protein
VWAPGPVGVGSGACVHRLVKIGLYGWPVGQTNALVHHIVIALLLTPLTMRGSIRRTVPYAAETLLHRDNSKAQIVSKQPAGMRSSMDVGQIVPAGRPRAGSALVEAIAAVDAATGWSSNPGHPRGSSHRRGSGRPGMRRGNSCKLR